MKKLLLTIGLFITCFYNVYAAQSDVTVEMEVEEATFGFSGTQSVNLTLADNFTKMFLKYGNEEIKLVINPDITEDTCGCRHYRATRPQSNSEEDENVIYIRYTVSLLDASECLCENRDFNWTASVREGLGWCGTGDSTMKLRGVRMLESPIIE